MHQLRLEFDDRDWRRAPTGEPIPPADYFLVPPRTYGRLERARERRRRERPQPQYLTAGEWRAAIERAASTQQLG